MLQIQYVSMVHTRDLRVLVRDLSFALGDGDKAVIIGEEGDGKSTLLAWIYAPERAIYCISHDRKYLSEVCSRVIRLTQDGLLEDPEEEWRDL